jgi:ABC-type nitrate/sulfonate/bicarbonate transport system substrate-binding protein
MKTKILKLIKTVCLAALVLFMIAGIFSCKTGSSQELKKITVILDWVPNTNHTGIYVARDQGYYGEAGLDVEIIQPSEGGSADLIAAGRGEFGISYQEQVTYARTAGEPLPIVAIAAIIQQNTSGFASPSDRNIKTPADFEGKKYGGWGSPTEVAMLRGLMEKFNADYSLLEIVNIGASDFFTSVERDVDFAWIFYGWDGIKAELSGFDLDFMLLQDVDPVLDFYTPLIIASEDMIKDDPELVRDFLEATNKGYSFAINDPQKAAGILLAENSELDENLVAASQKYLAGKYINNDQDWGFMELKIWEDFSGWMHEKGLLGKELDAENAFTNEFLKK